MHARSRLERDFSLGELLATIAVAGVLTAAAVPTFQSVISESRQAAVINQLVATMHMARSEVITQNARVVICLATDGEACTADAWAGGWFSFVDRNDVLTADPGAAQGEFTISGSRGVTAPRLLIVPVHGQARLSENHGDGATAAYAAG